MTSQKNTRPVLKPNYDEMLASCKMHHNNKINSIVEFCDIVENMNDDSQLLEFVDYCYWSYDTDTDSRLAISLVQIALHSTNNNAISQKLGELHIKYLAN